MPRTATIRAPSKATRRSEPGVVVFRDGSRSAAPACRRVFAVLAANIAGRRGSRAVSTRLDTRHESPIIPHIVERALRCLVYTRRVLRAKPLVLIGTRSNHTERVEAVLRTGDRVRACSLIVARPRRPRELAVARHDGVRVFDSWGLNAQTTRLAVRAGRTPNIGRGVRVRAVAT